MKAPCVAGRNNTLASQTGNAQAQRRVLFGRERRFQRLWLGGRRPFKLHAEDFSFDSGQIWEEAHLAGEGPVSLFH